MIMSANFLSVVSVLVIRAIASYGFELPKPEGGKGLNRHPSADWIQKFTIDPPEYSYNATNASLNRDNEYWANAFVKGTEYLLDLLDDLSITDAWLNSNGTFAF